MTTITCNDKVYKLFSSIKELPIILSKRMNAYLLQDVGIGSEMKDVDDHLARLMAFLQTDKKEEALEEAKNLRYNYFTMLSRLDFNSLALGCLIQSIDGVEVKDYSEDHLTELTNDLKGDDVETYLTEVKKNWKLNGN